MAIARTMSQAFANWSTTDPFTGAVDWSGADFAIVKVFTNSTATAITGTYKGVPLSDLPILTDVTGNKHRVLYIVNPASGSNTLSIDRTGGTNMSIAIAGYSGVDTANPIDAYIQDAGTTSTTSWTTSSLTVSDANCWLIGAFRDTDGSTASANILTFRVTTTVVPVEIWDSNGVVGSTGSKSVTYTISPSGRLEGHTLISLKPASTTVVNSGFFNFM